MNPERSCVYMGFVQNHTTTLGTYAINGGRQFAVDESRHDLLLCNACGSHRSFHRRVRNEYPPPPASVLGNVKRRKRTKFSMDQKVRMASFAEKIGWKIPSMVRSHEDDEVDKFCSEIGVARQTFKVWMQNHKHSAATAYSTNKAANGAVAPAGADDGDEEVQNSAQVSSPEEGN